MGAAVYKNGKGKQPVVVEGQLEIAEFKGKESRTLQM